MPPVAVVWILYQSKEKQNIKNVTKSIKDAHVPHGSKNRAFYAGRGTFPSITTLPAWTLRACFESLRVLLKMSKTDASRPCAIPLRLKTSVKRTAVDKYALEWRRPRRCRKHNAGRKVEFFEGQWTCWSLTKVWQWIRKSVKRKFREIRKEYGG